MPEVGPDWFEAQAKLKTLEPTQSDIIDALPEECAVEAVGVHGEKRIDFKGVPIKNADGSLNKYAHNLIDMHRPAAVAGSEMTQKLQGGDYAERAQQTAETERVQPLDAETANRIARARDLVRAPAYGSRTFRGRSVADAAGVPNLWITADGRLVRLALVGTRASSRVEVYSA
jgi:hypothetical protein